MSNGSSITSNKTDHEYTVDALNIEGIFFERLCRDIINCNAPWRVSSVNYPVEFPPPSISGRGQQSSLDIRCDLPVNGNLLTLVIECKKADPSFHDWIFFQHRHFAEHDTSPTFPSATYNQTYSVIERVPDEGASTWTTTTSINQIGGQYALAEDAIETHGNYRLIKQHDLTRVARDRITKASTQVALATRALLSEDEIISRELSGHTPTVRLQLRKTAYIPVIATTAKLKLCSFSASDVEIATGQIDSGKVRFIERPFLVYSFPLPRPLQLTPVSVAEMILSGKAETLSYMDIFVVNSQSFALFLQQMRDSARQWLDV